MTTSFYRSNGKFIVIGTILLLPLIIYGAVGSLRETSHDVRQWLPDDFEEIETYDWFVERFGRDEIAVVSWPGCTLDDGRVERLAKALSRATLADSVDNSVSVQRPVFDRVTTGLGALRILTSDQIQLSYGTALRRLSGNLVGPDGSTTGLLVSVSDWGSKNRGAAVDLIYRLAKSSSGVDADELRLGGPTVDAVANFRESRRMLYEMAGMSVVIVFVVAWLRLRRLALTIPLLVTGMLSTATALAALYYSGGKMSLTMTTLPILVFVLTTSAASHLTYYYRQALGETKPDDAPAWAIANGWRPCLLAALTTAIGLASLGMSRILPIREFGLFSALGMVISILVMLLVLPSLWVCWPLAGSKTGQESELVRRRPREAWQQRLATFVHRNPIAIVSGFGLLGLLAGIGVANIKSSVKIQDRFASDSRIIRDYRWIENNLIPLVPIEIVIRFDQQNELRAIQRLAFVRRVERAMVQIQGVGATVSAATFAPAIPRGGRARDFFRRSLLNDELVRDRQRYIDSGYIADGQGGELWRVTARVRALNDIDYGVFLDDVKQHVDSLLDANAIEGVSAEYTGAIPMIYKCLRLILGDLVRSFLLAFVIISVVMVIALRGVRFGLLAMIPNLFPILLVFGCMGWMGVAVESGIVKTASIALGIAVDDTFHFLAWYRRGLMGNKSRHETTVYVFERSAAAMVCTTLICGFGLSIFMLSTFMPIVRFAGLLIALLVVALVGDLVLLPALLATTRLPRLVADPDR